MFIDGRPKWQVGSLAEVAADTFFVDYTAHRIYIGENPAAKTVELTAHEFGMKLWYIDDADATIVRGLNFLGYGGQGLWIGGIPARVEDGTFAWNGVYGLQAQQAKDISVTNNSFVANGNGGLRLNDDDGAIVTGNHIWFNNVEQANTAWDAAGVKVDRTEDALFQNNLVERNFATGIWIDSRTFRIMTVENVVRFNTSGVFVEIAHADTVAFNIIHNNYYGILVSGSSDTRIYNNTLVNNGTAVVVREDERINDPTLNPGSGLGTAPANALRGNTWDTHGTVLVNNIYSGINESVLTYGTTIVELSRTTDQPVIYTVIDQYNLTDPTKTKTLPMTSASMVKASDYNLYIDPSATQPTAVRWDLTPTSGGQVNYATPAAFAAGLVGYESHAVVGNPLFVGTLGDDLLYYRPRTSSPAVGKATTVPADILAEAGRAQPTYLGAVPPDTAPTVASGPTYPATVSGTTASLSIRATDDADESLLTYTWSVVGTPPAAVTFSPNGTNASRDTTATFTKSGTYTLRVAIDDGSGNVVTRDFTLAVQINPTSPGGPSGRSLPIRQPGRVQGFAVGADASGPPRAKLYNADGTLRLDVTAFDSAFTGGVRTATGDFTGDGIPDIVVGTGPGSATLVRVIDGATGAVVFEFAPFESAFTGGVFVAAGDLTGDGVPDVVVTPDEGGGPRVIVYDGRSGAIVADFFGIDDPAFRGGRPRFHAGVPLHLRHRGRPGRPSAT